MRVPLHISLMASYLFVVAVLLVPTILYISTVQKRTARGETKAELRAEAVKLADALSRVDIGELPDAARLLIDSTQRRLTILDTSGRVLADSTGLLTENHVGRPEIRKAMTSSAGLGLDERLSSTTGIMTSYAAARFPTVGKPHGVVRIAVPVKVIEGRGRASTRFISGVGAFALTAAVIFSLIAALAISRPLRRIVEGARAFSQGEFGYDLGPVRSNELGDVARALSELAAQLRSRLLVSGADRAALHAFVNDLPVGVVLFDQSGAPFLINGRARELCQLTPQNEVSLAHELYELPEQASVTARVKEDGFTLEAPLNPPWIERARLRARWLALAAPDGSRQLALVIIDETAAEIERRAQTLRRAAEALSSTEPELSRQLEAIVGTGPKSRPALVRASDVRTVSIDELCEEAQAAAKDQLKGRSITVDLPADKVRVVDAEGRAFEALRDLFIGAGAASAEPEILVHVESQAAALRLWVRTRGTIRRVDEVARSLHALGGDAGIVERGELTETWVAIPRA